MDDNKIIELYFARSEDAIAETAKKYGKYCGSIARSILFSEQDVEECLNDTFLAAWNSIPPARPEMLSTYLGRLTRNISINRAAKERAGKRQTNAAILLDEVSEFTPDQRAGEPIDSVAFADLINRFLSGQKQKARVVFVRRYWHMESVEVIAKSLDMSVSAVKMTLMRTRSELAKFLTKEGYTL